MVEDQEKKIEINKLQKLNSKLELEIIQLQQYKDTLQP